MALTVLLGGARSGKSSLAVRRARSLAIHWTTKRMKKKAWPRKPMISQTVALSIIWNLST